MATLILAGAGAAIGGALLPAGISVFGTAISGAAMGAAVGGLAGSAIDQRLLAPHHRINQEGPRLSTVNITSSTEGAAIPRLAGRARMAGQIIWATRFEEEVRSQHHSQSAGKGQTVTTTTTTYHYFASFAVGLCEGPVTRIGRIWADGKEIDQTEVTIRKYLGHEDQEPDSLIEAKEGIGNTPAYRGLAYVVFDRLPIDAYGRRIPQIAIEVWRRLGDLEDDIRGVALIPGATEFGYDPGKILRRVGAGEWTPDNRHTLEAPSNWQASLDLLQEVAPNVQTVMLVATWFGNDLRCGECEIKPKVEGHNRSTMRGDGPPSQLAQPIGTITSPSGWQGGGAGGTWQVAGLSRQQAEVVSLFEGAPAYGGTPNDASVMLAIQDLKSRGLKVIFCPFIMMDVPAGNTLPNPFSDDAEDEGQPPHPWRGRITVSPAPGINGSPDQSSAAADQIDAFMSRQWGYRNFIRHYADLCASTGGVDAFLIGSEMVGLTTARSAAGTYPFVAALKSLAGECRSILGSGTLISYGADWSEYHSHRPGDGSGDVFFHLDPLWADENIDFVGIDNYLPVADWRDGTEHADYSPTGPRSIYDPGYLRANIEGGEYYDWHYAGEGARASQLRTPIEDTAHGEHWVFGNKDMRNWWLNAHHNRPGGVRESGSTGWQPQSKPIVFTEFGCPAVDKGVNQPNVFFDPKSSESFLPHFSSGARDDGMQRAYLEAMIGYWSEPTNNPASTVYSGPMIDMGLSCIWAWDARMVPSFPQDETAWADGPNWEVGHWTSGRLGLAPARETIRDILARAGFDDYEIEPIGSVVDAAVGDRILSPRAMIEALMPVHQVQAVESGGAIRLRSRLDAATDVSIGLDDLIEPESAGNGVGGRYRKVRAQETDLPAEIHLAYGDPRSDDQPGAAHAIRQETASRRVVEANAPVVMPADKAQSAAEAMLFDAWCGRERLAFGLPPSRLALEPGDIVSFAVDGEDYLVEAITEGQGRRLSLARMDAGLLISSAHSRRRRAAARRAEPGPVIPVFFDGPLLRDDLDPFAPLLGGHASPWAGGIAFWRAAGASGFTLDTMTTVPAQLGALAFPFWSGPVWRWDRSNELWVDMAQGQLVSAHETAVLAGANALGIINQDGEWEIVQFADAELMAPGRYRLTGLLRGQRGSEHAMRDPVEAGATVVVLDDALIPSRLTADHLGLPLTWRVGPAAHDIDQATYVEGEFTHEARAARPLAPVHAKARRDSLSDDLLIDWIRRTRIGGDGWAQPEVPLGEEHERYELEILDPNDDSVVRTVTGLSAPSYLYAAAEQQADFGFTMSTVRIAVYQVSQSVGRGIPLIAWAES